MFTFDNVEIPVTLEEVRSKVAEEDIFRRYCSNFRKINEPFLSDLYNDSNPSCRIFRKNGELRYKDFGNGDYYNCFSYLQAKYRCTFYEALNIIANDFNIKQIKQSISPKVIVTNDIIEPIIKSRIEIVIQPYNLTDERIWRKWGISLDLLTRYSIYSCSHIFLFKENKVTTFEYKKSNPIYAYDFGDGNYKIYKPLEVNKQSKWLSNVSKDILQGYKQLDNQGDILILTKSLKDVICYRVLGFNAIAPQSESSSLGIDYNTLLKRFKAIIVNFDEDQVGRYYSNQIMQQMGFKSFFIDKPFKDLAEYMEKHTVEEAKLMINNKINESISRGT